MNRHVEPSSMIRTALRVTGVVVLANQPSSVRAQCMLANPSFELFDGTFSGWNQFGDTGVATVGVPHGVRALRTSGVTSGAWEVSAAWQQLDTVPGARWTASACVWHSAAKPLVGDNRALINIEWRDASDQLIDFESFAIADATTPTDAPRLVTVESGPAPAGTVATRVLLGVLNSPDDPAADVFFDQVLFDDLGPPSIDDVQWNDFPGGRTLDFSGRSWRVKGPGFYGPGPNPFCDDARCTWVDGAGRLHLTLQHIGGEWTSTEVALDASLGYGDYVFTTVGRLDDFDPTVVLGMFLWQYGPCFEPENGWWNPYNEIDIEFSRWGDPANDVAQFVAQPSDWPGNLERFDMSFAAQEITTHAFRWLPQRVEYRSWRGGPDDEAPEALVHAWTYDGDHLPRPDQPRVHLNLWYASAPPTAPHEVVFDSFTFIPAGGACEPVPALGTWGLFGLAALLLVGGAGMIRQRQ